MKFENGDVIFESTGRREYCFGEGFACHPSSPEQISYGSDGAIGELTGEGKLTAAERQEVYDFSIAQWKAWLDAPVYEED